MKPTTPFSLTLLAFGVAALSQDAKPDLSKLDLSKMKPEEIRKVLAENPPVFFKVMVKERKWEEPAQPAKIVGPLYFVGTKGLSCWLIKSSEGFILMNTAMPRSGPMIEASIRKLGPSRRTLSCCLPAMGTPIMSARTPISKRPRVRGWLSSTWNRSCSPPAASPIFLAK